MRTAVSRVLVAFLVVCFAFPPGGVSAYQESGGVNVLSILPELICVGDTITLEGVATTDWPEIPTEPGLVPLAPLKITTVEISAQHGKVSPSIVSQSNDGYYFSFTYTAASEGEEDIRLILNRGISTHHEKFKVQRSCDFDAFLLTYMNFTADLGDEEFRSFTTVTGMGTMKRLRNGEPYFQGDGKWDLEENVLSKPAQCVQWYIPPLIASGPFELDGKIDEEGESVNVILAFQPSGKPTYHGKSICIDEDGNEGQAWSIAQGGNADLASKIQTDFPTGGGTQQVEMTGKGIAIVQSQGDLEYTAQLTLIPR